MARPTKLTPEIQKKIVAAISSGNYYEAACQYAGVDYATFRRWLIKGEEAKSGKYCEFCSESKPAHQRVTQTV